jgi:hypothetical protein
MELETLLYFVALLACPVGMGMMMWMMGRNMGGHAGQATPPEQTPVERLAALREQRKALEAEIGEMTRIVALEKEREQALAAQPAAAHAVQNVTVRG